MGNFKNNLVYRQGFIIPEVVYIGMDCYMEPLKKKQWLISQYVCFIQEVINMKTELVITYVVYVDDYFSNSRQSKINEHPEFLIFLI